jgi:DNA-binding LacI/PurR family transcriptional regulator
VLNKVTIYDVAERAGVSISTVSLTLNRPERVNATTRTKVLEVINRLGYTPKAAAVSHARRGVGRIGVLAPFTSYESYRRRLAGVLTEYEGTSHDVVVYDHESAAATVSPLLRTLPVTGRLDGLLIMGVPLEDSLAEHLLERQMPTVLVDSERSEFSSVNVRDDHGGALVARHLLDLGHTSFAFVQETQESQAFRSQAKQRLAGFRDALTVAGVESEAVALVTTTNDIAGGRSALRAILDRHPVPTAIFAHHDLLAAGILLECHSQGVKVPGTIAVAGFDDSNIAEATGLTSVRYPFEESGKVGARLLDRMLSGASESLQHIVLGLQLVIRDTT